MRVDLSVKGWRGQGNRMNRTMQGCQDLFQLGQVSNGFEVPAFAGTTSPPQPIHAIALMLGQRAIAF